jgi:DNA-directed RNA polymerase specialized sigma24 family protein
MDDGIIGNEPAFDKLYAFRDRLVRKALAEGMREHDAEDIAHDTIVRGWENRSKFRDGNVGAWLDAIFKNLVFEYWRAKKRAGVLLDNWDDVELPVWDCEGEPLRWLTPSVLSLLLPKDLAEVAVDFLDSDGRIPDITKRLSERKKRHISDHYTRNRLSGLKKALTLGLGCSFALDTVMGYLSNVEPLDDLLPAIRAGLCNGGKPWTDLGRVMKRLDAVSFRLSQRQMRAKADSGSLWEKKSVTAAMCYTTLGWKETGAMVLYLYGIRSTEIAHADSFFGGALRWLESMSSSPHWPSGSEPWLELLTAELKIERSRSCEQFCRHIERLRKKIRNKI